MERAAIVQYLRSEAAVTLFQDMPTQDQSVWPEWETAAAILEVYADAIERGDYFRCAHGCD